MKPKFKFSSSAWEYNNRRIINQVFKLLPMYENEEDWQKQQQTMLLELKGYNEVLRRVRTLWWPSANSPLLSTPKISSDFVS